MYYDIIHIEDNNGDAILLKTAMVFYNCQFKIYNIKNADEFQKLLIEDSNLETKLFIIDSKLASIDGETIIAKLKNSEKYKYTPIIMLSGSSHSMAIESCIKAGANLFYTKPFQFYGYKDFIDIISKYIYYQT